MSQSDSGIANPTPAFPPSQGCDHETEETLFGSLFSYLRNRQFSQLSREDLEDVVQEVLVSALQAARKQKIDGPEHLRRWCFTVAYNKAVDLYRDRIGHPQDDVANRPDLPDTHALPGAELERMQRAAIVRKALAKLDPDERTVLEKRYFEDKPLIDVAKDLGIPYGTVASRLHNAKKRLHRLLNNAGITGRLHVHGYNRTEKAPAAAVPEGENP